MLFGILRAYCIILKKIKKLKMFKPTTRIIDLTLEEFGAFLEEKWKSLKSHIRNHSEAKEPEFMNVEGCATLTGYKPGYIRQLVFKREIPFHKNRKPLKFKRSEIVEWMETECKTTLKKRATDFINNNRLTASLKKTKEIK